MGKMQDKLQEVADHMRGKVDEVAANLMENMEKATQGVRDNAATLTETTASYQDALMKAAPPNPHNSNAAGVGGHESLLAPRTQAREGAKAQQVLIDIGGGSGAGLPEEFATSTTITLKRKLDKDLEGCQNEGTPNRFKVKAVTCL